MREAVLRGIDTHVHIVDPARFPPPPGPGHKPRPGEAGTVAMLAGELDRAGIAHAVLVQLSGYGTDNRCVLDALEQGGGRFRAILSLAADIGDAELDALVRAGVAGVRFNVVNLGRGALAGQERLLAMLAERGLVAQIQCPLALLGELGPLLAPLRGPVLLDHFGMPDPSTDLAGPGFASLHELADRGAYLKLSGAFRLSRSTWPHRDLDNVVAALLCVFPRGRRVWGSDWPFVACGQRPLYAEALASLARWLPDAEDRFDALVTTPSGLFGFGLEEVLC